MGMASGAWPTKNKMVSPVSGEMSDGSELLFTDSKQDSEINEMLRYHGVRCFEC